MSKLEARLAQLGLKLPPIQPASSIYKSAMRIGSTIRLAGLLPIVGVDEILCRGVVGRDVVPTDAGRCVTCCVLNAMSWIAALTDEDGAHVEQVLRVDYFFQVDQSSGFSMSELAGIGSRLLADILGPAGTHVGSVVGVRMLPNNSPVAINMEVGVRRSLRAFLLGRRDSNLADIRAAGLGLPR